MGKYGYYRTQKVSTSRGGLTRMGYRVRRPARRPRPTASTAAGTPARPRMGQRVRYGQGSRTQTRRKKGTKIVRPTKTGENSSNSNCIIDSKWASYVNAALYKQVLGRRTKIYAQNRTDVSIAGQQFYGSFLYNLKDDLEAMKLDAADVATNNEVRIFMGKLTQRTFLRNQSNGVCKVVMYDLVARRDANLSAVNAPEEAWVKGNVDFGQVTVANKPMAHFIPGTSPSKSPEFRFFWDVKKVTTVNLEAGQQHEHVAVRKFNRVVKSTSWEHAQANVIKNLTGGVLYVFYGALAHETDLSAITFAPVRIDAAQTREFSYGYIKQNQPAYTVEGDIFKNTAIVNLDFMGESADVDADPMSA